MNETLAHTLIIIVALVCVSALAAIDLFHGGDGATITGAFTVIGGLVAYEFGKGQVQNNSTS